MTARATPTVEALSDSPPDTARLYQEGMTAGVIGAATVALWFLLLDSASGHPLYTPTVLGTAIFRRAALATPETLSVSLEMVGMFTWIHVLIFAALGGVASRLLAMVEHKPNVSSGGRTALIEIGQFLRAGANGPEHQALLKLIGILVND